MPSDRMQDGERRARLARIAAPIAIWTIMAAGCTPSATYDPPDWSVSTERDVGFVSAVMLDATNIVFSWGGGRFRYVAADPLWGKGQREYVFDEDVIGVYDLEAGAGRVVFSDRKDRLGDGNGDFTIVSARGGAALVYRDRTTENGVLVDPGGWSLVSLESGELTALDFEAELAPFGRELSHTPRLVGNDGTLLLRTRAPRGAASGDGPRLFLRRPGEPPVDLGDGALHGELRGWIFLRRPGAGGAEMIHARTGEVRLLSAAELAEHAREMRTPRVPASVRVLRDGSAIVLTHGSDAAREESVIAVDVEALPRPDTEPIGVTAE